MFNTDHFTLPLPEATTQKLNTKQYPCVTCNKPVSFNRSLPNTLVGTCIGPLSAFTCTTCDPVVYIKDNDRLKDWLTVANRPSHHDFYGLYKENVDNVYVRPVPKFDAIINEVKSRILYYFRSYHCAKVGKKTDFQLDVILHNISDCIVFFDFISTVSELYKNNPDAGFDDFKSARELNKQHPGSWYALDSFDSSGDDSILPVIV